MSSYLLLAAVTCLIAVPGIPASLLLFSGREGAVVTRLAAAFGLGFTVAAGCAFGLAAAHVFWLGSYLGAWAIASAILWAWSARRAPLRDQLHAIGSDIGQNKIALAVGALVLLTLMTLHLRYLGVLNGPRYIYYLNGIEIANSHGVPAATLEYGQAWPPATDKIYLDAFTGVLVLISAHVAIGPPVLLVTSLFGAAIGLWAAAWELGLRGLGILIPVLYLGNALILNTAVSVAYTDYRAEDFGRAVAFCALAVGIAAIRERGWRLGVGAGLILAAASGTHLIPVVFVALALALYGIAQVFFSGTDQPWSAPLRRGLALAGVAGVGGVAIRLFAGGSFGLQGAQGAASYASLHLAYDPTAYLYGGLMYPSGIPGSAHWYAHPGVVIESMVAGGVALPGWEVWLWLGTPVLAAVVLLAGGRGLRSAGLVGLGLMIGIVAVGVMMAVTYHSYIEQTFGIRRLATYVALAFLLLIVAVGEAYLRIAARARPRVAAAASLVIVLGLAAWLLPSTGVTRKISYYGQQRTRLVDWLRADTPCNARFLVNQRTEGTLTSLTGRFSLIEGMGPFLRTDRLPYVVSLVHGAKMFFRAPLKREWYLLRHDISFIIVARGFQELGYQAPIGPPNMGELNRAPFLKRVYASGSLFVYQVTADPPSGPASPLLTGRYLHCRTGPVHI
ncbi:MAG: hypothetical protein ACYCO9_01445 [Streptosporangiaceae bacterium]